MKAAASAALVSGSRPLVATSSGMAVDGHDFPDWAVEEIAEALARYRTWKGNETTIAFPVITDVHSNLVDDGSPFTWSNPRNHVYFLRKIAELVEADWISDLGDHDFDVSAFTPIPFEEVRPIIAALVARYAREPRPVLFCQGNHDHSYENGRARFTTADYGATFCRGINEPHGHMFVASACGTWGYYDVAAKRVRAIYLNTNESDSQVIGYSAAQLQFLADALMSAPDGWHVVLQQHADLPWHIGHWRRNIFQHDPENAWIFQQMLDDFVNRRGKPVNGWGNPPASNYGGVTWDFSRSKAFFVGGFYGHAHWENHLEVGGVHYTLLPGYGTVPEDCLSGGARDPKHGGAVPRGHMLIDLVAIKPERRLVHVFRFGFTGGRTPFTELEYEYGTSGSTARAATHRWTGANGNGKWSDAGNWCLADGATAQEAPGGESIVEVAGPASGAEVEILLPCGGVTVRRLKIGGEGTVRFQREQPDGSGLSRRLGAGTLEIERGTSVALDEGIVVEAAEASMNGAALPRGGYTGSGDIGTVLEGLEGRGVIVAGEGLRVADFGRTTSCYVQEGLIAHWDGLENAAYGVYDGLAAAWKDLAGTTDLSLREGAAWRRGCLLCDGTGGNIAAQAASPVDSARTIEVVYRCTSKSNDLQVILDLGCGGRFVVHNTRDGVVQFTTSWGRAAVLAPEQCEGRDLSASATFETTDVTKPADATFLDGETSEGTYGESWTSCGQVTVGRCANPNRVFKGRVYAIRIYDHTLTPSEIRQNARVDRMRFGLGTVDGQDGMSFMIR